MFDCDVCNVPERMKQAIETFVRQHLPPRSVNDYVTCHVTGNVPRCEMLGELTGSLQTANSRQDFEMTDEFHNM